MPSGLRRANTLPAIAIKSTPLATEPFILYRRASGPGDQGAKDHKIPQLPLDLVGKLHSYQR